MIEALNINLNSTKRFKILVVEDSFITSFHLQKLLELNGFNVLGVKSAEEVLAEIKTNHFDLILMDIMLSGKMSGIEAAQTIRQFSNIPILFLSALTDQSTRNVINAIDLSGHENKPFNEKSLLDKITDLIGKAPK